MVPTNIQTHISTHTECLLLGNHITLHQLLFFFFRKPEIFRKPAKLYFINIIMFTRKQEIYTDIVKNRKSNFIKNSEQHENLF